MYTVLHMTEAQSDLAHRALATLKIDAVQPIAPAVVRAFLRHDDNVLAVAFSDEQPIGYAVAYDLPRVDGEHPMLLLYEVSVASAWRRRGVGSALVERVLAVARSRNAVKTWVLTDPTNAPARALYASCRADDRGPNQLYVWNQCKTPAGSEGSAR